VVFVATIIVEVFVIVVVVSFLHVAVNCCPLLQNPVVAWKRCSLAFDDFLIALRC
jgi:hypothetical protein